ncbi:aromatic ring-hydroxylating oxygenase subunit alpha [Sandaracinus amylolyticus]|uniref:aromatic ring-hydroxylating oxygenase subunit alpha n=1 Tax=Sandaracinus amylolyticus TaxID=927083 RepID=UPI001F2F5606|nr:Rieske 2Fe-2S domain-containing protein [Sandaracinus amylolyticus]UJR86856.1 Hypothetical protein I5071_89570 [Sandaracinus amylolyticus]
MNERRLPVLDPTRDPAANLYDHFPSGWFDLARSNELDGGRVLTRRLAGRDVVLYRTEFGVPCAVSPHCPHMGAHLGCGGKVSGESIVCPFHAFEFDREGRCTKTGYGTPPPPRARLTTYAVHEIHGCVFVWHGAAGEAPTFRIPHLDDAHDGSMPMLDRVFELRGHPQETSENSVDVGHFGPVHGYSNVKIVEPLRVDGASLTTTYSMDRPMIPGRPKLGSVHAVFQIHVHGLGYSMVEVKVPSLGFESRHYVLATPTERERVRLRVGFSVRRGTLRLPFASRIARDLVEAVFMQVGIRVFAHDVGQDFEIWKNKRYVHPPQLAVGDGPVGTYRRWARQFYPVNGAPSSSTEDIAAE